MDVLIVGSSGREHALAWALRQSPRLTRLLVAPGNAGTASIAENVPIGACDVDGLARLARDRKVTLVVVGPEDALIRGLADRIAESRIPVFGPSAAAATVVVRRYAASDSYDTERADNRTTAGSILEDDPPFADEPNKDLAATVRVGGRYVGRVIARGRDDLRSALTRCPVPVNSLNLSIDETPSGIDVSGYVLTDGHSIISTPLCLDYYRLLEGGRGPMTAGMGGVAPPIGADIAMASRLHQEAVRTLLADLNAQGHRYVGIVGTWMRIETDGAASVRLLSPTLGDPQAQTLLPLLESDLLELMWDAVHHQLEQRVVSWSDRASVSVVLVPQGYPGETPTDRPIHGSEAASEHGHVFHGGTKRDNRGRLVTSSGRILTAVGLGETIDEARAALP